MATSATQATVSDSSNTSPEHAPTTQEAAEIELVAQCLCKAHTFTTRVPIPERIGESVSSDIGTAGPLPLEAVYCHCTSCRRSTGGMYSVSVPWPGNFSHNDQNHASLGRYKRSPGSPATGLFCVVCGSLLFYELVLPASYGAVTEQVVKHGVFLGCLRAYELDTAGKRIGSVKGEEYTLVEPKDHLFVGDTIDGGATCWLRGWWRDKHGQEVKLWVGHRGLSEEFVSSKTVDSHFNDQGGHNAQDHRQDPLRAETLANQPGREQYDTAQAEEQDPEQIPETVHIKCHCQGVDLVLQTGNSRREYLHRIEQKQQLPWFVNPLNGKPIGSIDGCDSCTTSSGGDLFYWTFAEVKYLSYPLPSRSGSPSSQPPSPFGARVGSGQLRFPRDTVELKAAVEENMRRLERLEQPISFPDSDPRQVEGARVGEIHPLGTLSFYASSPDVQRYFCARCSATIFYACDDRPEMVDIAMGVICPSDGTARAESIITWKLDKVGWRGDIAAPGSGRAWARRLLSAVEGTLAELRGHGSEGR